MIKDAELRKGNLLILNVSYKEVIHRVDEIYTDEVKVTSLEDNACFPRMRLATCRPIPLTPKWLVDHGFECKEHRNRFFRGEEGTTMGYKISQDLILIPNFIRDASGNFDGFVTVDSRGIRINMRLIHFAHQLQNVYLDFTGEELTIKETV